MLALRRSSPSSSQTPLSLNLCPYAIGCPCYRVHIHMGLYPGLRYGKLASSCRLFCLPPWVSPGARVSIAHLLVVLSETCLIRIRYSLFLRYSQLRLFLSNVKRHMAGLRRHKESVTQGTYSDPFRCDRAVAPVHKARLVEWSTFAGRDLAIRSIKAVLSRIGLFLCRCGGPCTRRTSPSHEECIPMNSAYTSHRLSVLYSVLGTSGEGSAISKESFHETEHFLETAKTAG